MRVVPGWAWSCRGELAAEPGGPRCGDGVWTAKGVRGAAGGLWERTRGLFGSPCGEAYEFRLGLEVLEANWVQGLESKDGRGRGKEGFGGGA